MTSPTDLAERLREIARRYKLYPGAEFEQDAQDLREAAKVLSALESAASGAVTDEDVERAYTAYENSFGQRMGMRAALAVLGPRLAKGAMCERVLYGTEKYLTDKEGHIALRLYAALERLAKAEQLEARAKDECRCYPGQGCQCCEGRL